MFVVAKIKKLIGITKYYQKKVISINDFCCFSFTALIKNDKKRMCPMGHTLSKIIIMKNLLLPDDA